MAFALLAGCGRLDFDPAALSAIDAGPDARVFPLPPTSQADCPPNYTFELASCYFYEANLSVDWLTAERNCEAVGAHLVVVTDAPEAMKVDMLPPGNIVDHWYGGSDRITDGTFITVTGEPLVPAFDPGEPMSGKHCLQLLDNTNINTAQCTDTNNYVCELDGRPPIEANF